MRVTCVQFDVAWQDRSANFAKVRELLAGADACEAGGLIVLPEMFSTGFSMDVQAATQDQPSPAEGFLAEIARQHGCYTLGGVVNADPDGRGLNEAVLVGPDGRHLMRYAKMHPFSYAGESQHFAPGDAPVVTEIADTKLSPFICYDLRFPEVFRSAALAGAEVMAVIANWPASRAEHFQTLLTARAIENQAWVVGVNRVGSDPDVRYSGGSVVIDPRGLVVARAGDGEVLLTSEIDVQALRQYRREFPVLADARRGWVRRLDQP